MKKKLLLLKKTSMIIIVFFMFSVNNLKAQSIIDGTWHSTSGSTFYVYYDVVNDVIGAINVSDGSLFIYDYNGLNPYDGNMDYICNYSSRYDNAGVGNFMEIYNSNSITVIVGTTQNFWTKSYANWYSQPSYTYYNYYWNPQSFYKINPQVNTKPIPTNPKYNNVTNPKTNPKNGTVPTTHTNPKNK